jgi:acyl carrier protein
MTQDVVADAVIGLIGRTFGIDTGTISRQTQAADVDGWDSLSHAVLLSSIERHFGIRLDLERVLDVENVGELIDCVEVQLGDTSAIGT